MPERRDPLFESPNERHARERPKSIDLCGLEVRRFDRPEGEGSQFSPDRFRHFCFDDSRLVYRE